MTQESWHHPQWWAEDPEPVPPTPAVTPNAAPSVAPLAAPMATPIATPPDHPPIISTPRETLGARVKRALAPLAGVGALLAKFGALLIKLKAFTVVGTMAISVAAYTTIWGWKFALGFVLLILVHEMGHVVVLRARGIKASAPIFLPFLGAFVSMKSQPRSVYEEAESALAGPVMGTVGAAIVAYAGHATGSDLLQSLAFTGFFLNLFNLLPALPLDGGRVAGALHPAVWLVGLVGLLAYEIERPSPVVLIILVFGGYELWQRWRNRHSTAAQVYFALQPGQRLRIGAAYLALIAVLVVGIHATYLHRTIN